MKNIQVIDGASNCTFSIFQATEEEFVRLFPEPGQEIQFSDDLANLSVYDEVASALSRVWERSIRKRDVQGIHGTLSIILIIAKNFIVRNERMGLIPEA